MLNKPKLTEDGIIMEFTMNDEHESELVRVGLFCYINARVNDLPENTHIRVERDGDDVRVISDKGREAVVRIVGECFELICSMED